MLYNKGPEGEKCFIYLGISSSVITSGMRDIITYLCQHKLIDQIVTTGCAVQEDIMKCFSPYELKNQENSKNIENYYPSANILNPKSNIEKYKVFMNELLDEILKE